MQTVDRPQENVLPAAATAAAAANRPAGVEDGLSNELVQLCLELIWSRDRMLEFNSHTATADAQAVIDMGRGTGHIVWTPRDPVVNGAAKRISLGCPTTTATGGGGGACPLLFDSSVVGSSRGSSRFSQAARCRLLQDTGHSCLIR